VNAVFFTGLDEAPDFSRSASRPSKKEKLVKKPDMISGSLTIGGSNAKKKPPKRWRISEISEISAKLSIVIVSLS
jgi:hypothetical protein